MSRVMPVMLLLWGVCGSVVASDSTGVVVPPVDIKAVAHREVAEAEALEATRHLPRQSSVDVRMALILIASALSLFGTIVLMAGILNPSAQPVRVTVATQPRRKESAADAILDQARLILNEKTRGKHYRTVEQVHTDPAALLRRMHELTLQKELLS